MIRNLDNARASSEESSGQYAHIPKRSLLHLPFGESGRDTVSTSCEECPPDNTSPQDPPWLDSRSFVFSSRLPKPGKGCFHLADRRLRPVRPASCSCQRDVERPSWPCFELARCLAGWDRRWVFSVGYRFEPLDSTRIRGTLSARISRLCQNFFSKRLKAIDFACLS